MSRYNVSCTTDFALVAATAKTAIRINTPASRKAILRRIVITDKLAGSTDEGIEYAIQTGGTDGTGTAYTPIPLNNAAASVSTAKTSYTVEPTATTQAMKNGVPAGGGIDISFEGEDGLQVPHSSGFGVVLTSTQARASGIVEVTLTFEE